LPVGKSKGKQKMTSKLPQTLRLAPVAAMLLIACGSTFTVYAATLTISPATGAQQVGQPFDVSVSVSGLDPLNDLYAYSFDLAFDPTAFKVLTANDGTIFDYAGNTGVYFDGAINNTLGFVTAESGLDINGSFNGTSGLLGRFTFEALRPAASATIAVQNVSLSTLAAASSLAPPDIDPGTLPLATLSAANVTAVPEPGAGGLAVLAVAGAVLIRQRLRNCKSCLPQAV
jgi:MYXO-CTERM domain-containing protein